MKFSFQDILIESDIVAPGSVAGVLSGKHYNRSLRAHKIMYEGLMRLLFQSFLRTQSSEKCREIQSLIGKYMYKSKNDCTVEPHCNTYSHKKTAKEHKRYFLIYCKYIFVFSNIDSIASSYPREFHDKLKSTPIEELLTSVETFAKSRCDCNPTFALWLLYLEIVQVLLLFVRATRENNFELHLSAVRSMLPWFFVADRVHYARYGTMYWLEMSCLEDTHPGNVYNVMARTFSI